MRQVTLFAAAQVAAALLFAGAPKAFAQTVETPAPAASNVSASLERFRH